MHFLILCGHFVVLQLIDMAVKMEASRLNKCGINPGQSHRVQSSVDLQAGVTVACLVLMFVRRTALSTKGGL